MHLAGDDKGEGTLLANPPASSRDALAGLYDRHAASLYRHALALSRRQPDAEDLVQAVFLKLAMRGAEMHNVRDPSSYLHRMLHTTWVDAGRRVATAGRVVEEVAAPPSTSSPATADAIDLARALEALSAAQREVIVLHLVEGFSFREVGKLTGVPLFTAAARYRLAINRLRITLGNTRGS